MQSISRTMMTALVVVAMVGIVLGTKFMVKARAGAVKAPVASGRTFGVADASVKIIEFTDLQCPACARAATVVHDQLQKNGARVFFEFRHFPLAMHKNSRKAAIVTECALDQGKFWPMQEALFRSQEAWGALEDPNDIFLSLARGVGVDDQKMMRCLFDPAVAARVDADTDEGRSKGVRSTPTFFVNGKMVVGAPNFEEALKEALQ